MSQLYTVSGMPKAKRRQTDELNARLGLLPSMLSQQNQKQFQSAQLADMAVKQKMDEARYGLEQGKFGLAQQELGLKKRETDIAQSAADYQQTRFGWEQSQAQKSKELQEMTQQREMGVKAAGLGFTALSSGIGGYKMGDLGNKASSLWSGLFGDEKKLQPQLGTGVGGYGGEETPSISGNMNTGSSGGTFSSLPVGSMVGGGLAGFAGGQLLGGKSKPMKSLLGAGIGAGVGYFAGDGGWAGALGGGLLGGLGGLF
jgi:hypothetical protein